MVSKICLVLVAITLVIQCYGSPLAIEVRTELTDLSENVNADIEYSSKFLKKKSVEGINSGKSSIIEATELLQKTVDKSIRTIKYVMKEAEERGYDVGHCIKNSIQEIKNSTNAVQIEMHTLIAGLIADIKNITTEASSNMSSFSDYVEKLQIKFASCDIGILGFKCHMEVQNEVLQLITDTRIEIYALEMNAIVELGKIKSHVIESTFLKVSEAQVNVTLKAEEVKNCINVLCPDIPV